MSYFFGNESLIHRRLVYKFSGVTLGGVASSGGNQDGFLAIQEKSMLLFILSQGLYLQIKKVVVRPSIRRPIVTR